MYFVEFKRHLIDEIHLKLIFLTFIGKKSSEITIMEIIY